MTDSDHKTVRARIVTRVELDAEHCSDCGEQHKDHVLVLLPACHPDSGLLPVYAVGVIVLFCLACRSPVRAIKVADGDPTEDDRAKTREALQLLERGVSAIAEEHGEDSPEAAAAQKLLDDASAQAAALGVYGGVAEGMH